MSAAVLQRAFRARSGRRRAILEIILLILV